MRFARRAIVLAVAAGLATVLPLHVEQVVAAPAARGVAKAAMARRLPDVKLQNVGLSDAIEFIRDVSGSNVVVNWRALAEAGVTKETPVNVRLNGVSLHKVLTTVLSEAGAGTALTYVIADDVIEVTTQTIADQKLYMKVYPIDDLIMEIPNFTDAPDFNLSSKSGSGGGGGGSGSNGGGSSGGLFQTNGGGDKKEVSKTKEERAEELITLIRETIRAEVWKENGGTASIRYFNGNLVISAPLSVHELIGG